MHSGDETVCVGMVREARRAFTKLGAETGAQRGAPALACVSFRSMHPVPDERGGKCGQAGRAGRRSLPRIRPQRRCPFLS